MEELKIEDFEDFLEQQFIDRGEWNEHAITKDTMGSDFEDYMGSLDAGEWLELGEKYGQSIQDLVDLKIKEISEKQSG